MAAANIFKEQILIYYHGRKYYSVLTYTHTHTHLHIYTFTLTLTIHSHESRP